MSQFYGSMGSVSRGRVKAPAPLLKSFRMEEDTLNTSDKISRLEARIAILEHENAKLTKTCETQSTKVALLQRFCKYHAIKLKIEDAYERETNTAQAMNNMKAEIDGLSLNTSTISGITDGGLGGGGNGIGGGSVSRSPREEAALKVRYDRRVHGGGNGIENRFLYGSESVSQHKWMGPADGVASPRLLQNNSKRNAEENKFRIRLSKDIHGYGSKDAQLIYGSQEYEKRLVEEAKAHLARKDNRRRKVREPDETKTDLFGRAREHPTPKILNTETEKLDETLFAGMLNPKEQRNGSNERHSTDLRSEAQIQHRCQYRGKSTSRPAEIRLFKN
jgi:hypothetical protein